MKQYMILLLFFTHLLVNAQTVTDSLNPAVTAVFPVQSNDSTLRPEKYSHTIQYGVCLQHGIDSVVCTDSTVCFRFWLNTDECQNPTFSFVLTIDSAAILRVTILENHVMTEPVCEGFNCNRFVIQCSKTSAFTSEIKGVGYSHEDNYVPLQQKSRKKR